MGHALMEKRSGLLVGACLTRADEHAERVAALALIEPHADRLKVTPYVAQNMTRRSAIDRRTTRHPGFAMSQRVRKRIEEEFGWIKTIAEQEKTRFCGVEQVGFTFTLAAAAYNLVCVPRLLGGAR